MTALSAARGAVSLGQPRVHLRRTESTNTFARHLAAGGAPHGTLVTAGEQSAGRGRQGRGWSAPPGSSLLSSWVIREPAKLLSLAGGVAVAEVCGEYALLKWPNDVMIDGRKVAGILVEGRPQERWAVLGIGINVALEPELLPEELRDRAGTLGRPSSELEPTLERLRTLLEYWLGAPDEKVLEAVRARDALHGRRISWGELSGVAHGIDSGGRLEVKLDGGGRMALDAGEVHLSRF
jgi:BirA family transcriptional regulator, biotin operon repressor / biotin---[acetyl-CoA-carboxylase] ligase